MKTNIRTAVIILGVAIAILSGCKKYEEDPGITLASKKSLLCRNWNIQVELLNGSLMKGDTNQYGDELPPTIYSNHIFKFFGDGLLILSGYPDLYGKWNFVEHKNYLEINIDGVPDRMEIIKLSRKELWLRKTDTDVYELRLKARIDI